MEDEECFILLSLPGGLRGELTVTRRNGTSRGSDANRAWLERVERAR
jgi:hypothetical protein